MKLTNVNPVASVAVLASMQQGFTSDFCCSFPVSERSWLSPGPLLGSCFDDCMFLHGPAMVRCCYGYLHCAHWQLEDGDRDISSRRATQVLGSQVGIQDQSCHWETEEAAWIGVPQGPETMIWIYNTERWKKCILMVEYMLSIHNSYSQASVVEKNEYWLMRKNPIMLRAEGMSANVVDICG